MNIAFEETGKSAAWMITPLPHPQIDAAVYQFAVELQIGIHITLMRDVMGPAFVPDNVTVTHCASESHLLPELVGCPILVDQPANQIVFDAAWLDRKAMLGNRAPHAAVLAICDDLLHDLMQRGGVAGEGTSGAAPGYPQSAELRDRGETLGERPRER